MELMDIDSAFAKSFCIDFFICQFELLSSLPFSRGGLFKPMSNESSSVRLDKDGKPMLVNKATGNTHKLPGFLILGAQKAGTGNAG